jgi:hypothetical protein
MKIASEHIDRLESLGYTTDEARFLYIVATFSGYFVPRQFIAFTGAKWGSRSANLTRKLESRGHASWREYPQLDGVYHLWSRVLYRAINKEHLRNRRRHSPDFIRTRLLALDFVLANQEFEYLETEADKVRHFREELGIGEDVFPVKEFSGSPRGEPVLRYFVDQFPMYVAPRVEDSASRVTFTYVDPGHASLAGFRHHLGAHKRIFAALGPFDFVYLSNTSAHFMRAEQWFSSFLERAFSRDTSTALSGYFTLRAKWDAKRFAELSPEDVESLELLSQRFQGPDTERLYSAWCAGQRFADDLGSFLGDKDRSHDVRFECRLISSGRVISKELELTG